MQKFSSYRAKTNKFVVIYTFFLLKFGVKTIINIPQEFKVWIVVLHYIVLYHTVQHTVILKYSTIFYCTILYCTILYCTILYCTILFSAVLFGTVTSFQEFCLIYKLWNVCEFLPLHDLMNFGLLFDPQGRIYSQQRRSAKSCCRCVSTAIRRAICGPWKFTKYSNQIWEKKLMRNFYVLKRLIVIQCENDQNCVWWNQRKFYSIGLIAVYVVNIKRKQSISNCKIPWINILFRLFVSFSKGSI